jgi:hypothetical protein
MGAKAMPIWLQEQVLRLCYRLIGWVRRWQRDINADAHLNGAQAAIAEVVTLHYGLSAAERISKR